MFVGLVEHLWRLGQSGQPRKSLSPTEAAQRTPPPNKVVAQLALLDGAQLIARPQNLRAVDGQRRKASSGGKPKPPLAPLRTAVPWFADGGVLWNWPFE
jgi:hypothetical protein